MPRYPAVLAAACVALAAPAPAEKPDGITRVRLLPPGPGNPRNSEGAFVTLKDGRVLFVYTHFTGGGADHAAAHLASRVSSDGGKTWTDKDEVVVPNEGKQNVMSVSLLRLADGRIALFYLKKDGPGDCRLLLRTSTDEAKTWSAPTLCMADAGYYVVNNDRVIQLKSGRLVVPAARHPTGPKGRSARPTPGASCPTTRAGRGGRGRPSCPRPAGAGPGCRSRAWWS